MRPTRLAFLLVFLVALWTGSAQAASSPVVVSLTFDDGLASQTLVQSMLEAHGMDGTFFVSSELVGDAGHMTWRDLQALASDGNEIGGHTLDHVDLTTVSSTEARRQVCEDRARLMNRGFRITSFAYPNGAGYNNSTVRTIVKQCGYNSARRSWGLRSASCTTCALAETIPPKDVYATRTPDSVRSDTTLATIESYVTRAETNGGGWVQIVFHEICDHCDQYSTSPGTLDAFLDWLAPRSTQGTTVKTVNEVIAGTLLPSPGTTDSSPPLSTIGCDGAPCGSDAYSQPVEVSLSATDSGGSGVEAIRYTTDGSTPTLASAVYPGPFMVTQTATIKYRAWDNAGNAEGTKTQQIAIAGSSSDTTPPVSSITCDGTACTADSYNSAVQVALGATDDSSGVATIRFTTDGSDPTLASSEYSIAFTISETTTVKYRAWDNEGNAESTNSQQITIAVAGGDTTPPVSSITCNGTPCASSWYTAAVNVALSALDDASGVATIRYTTDGTEPTLASPAYSGPFTVSQTTTVRYRAWDVAGNAEQTNTQSMQIDATPPAVAVISPIDGATVTGTVRVNVTASDSESGVAKVQLYVDGKLKKTTTSTPYRFNWNSSNFAKGQHTLTAVATDRADNRATSAPITVTVV